MIFRLIGYKAKIETLGMAPVEMPSLSTQAGLEINPSMTVMEIAEKSRIPVEKLIKRLGMTGEDQKGLTLEEVQKQFQLEPSDIIKIVNELDLLQRSEEKLNRRQ